MISDNDRTEFDRVMTAYWHSLEGMEHARRVGFYIAKQAELMAAWQPWNLTPRSSSHVAMAGPYQPT